MTSQVIHPNHLPLYRFTEGNLYPGLGLLGDGAEQQAWIGDRTDWSPVHSWGLSGWDLGNPPYVTVYTRDPAPALGRTTWGLLIVTEGDTDAFDFYSQPLRTAAINGWALWQWINHPTLPEPVVPARVTGLDLDTEAWNQKLLRWSVEGAPEALCDPFAWARLEASKKGVTT